MKRIALAVTLYSFAIVAFAGETKPAAEPVKQDEKQEIVLRKLSIDMLTEYLNRWGVKHFEMDIETKLAVFDVMFDGERLNMWMGILGEDTMLFVAFRDVAVVKKDDTALMPVLQLLMKENYETMIGSWAWDAEKGEVAFFYVFLASGGLAYKDFASGMDTLLAGAARVKKELNALVKSKSPEQGKIPVKDDKETAKPPEPAVAAPAKQPPAENK